MTSDFTERKINAFFKICNNLWIRSLIYYPFRDCQFSWMPRHEQEKLNLIVFDVLPISSHKNCDFIHVFHSCVYKIVLSKEADNLIHNLNIFTYCLCNWPTSCTGLESSMGETSFYGETSFPGQAVMDTGKILDVSRL